MREGEEGKVVHSPPSILHSPFSILHFPLSLFLAAFLVLGVTYSIVNPLFEAPDEVWHYLYVKHLADGKGLPVHDLISEQPWRQEGSQPPLYYLAGALATAWVDTDDADDVIRYNPHAAIGLATAYGNKNVMAHTARESFPWQGTVLAAHLARLLSVLMGAGTVVCTYLLALEIFPRRRALAAGAAAINAFNPQFLFISAAINNDIAVTLFSSLALWLLIRALRRTPSPPLLLALGVAVGLAALSKLSGLGLLPLVAVGLALLAWRRRSPRAFVVWSLIVFGAALAVAGWWYGRNWLLYRDPLGLPVMFAVMGRRAHPPSGLELVAEFVGVWKSFWAVFGWYNVLAEGWVYAVCNGLTLLGIAGLMLLVVKGFDTPWFRYAFGYSTQAATQPKCLRGTAIPTLSELILLGLWTAIVLASLVGWSQMRYPQGRLLFPAISAISLLLFVGLAQWIPKRFTGGLASVVGMGLLALSLISPFRMIAPAYAPPPLLAPEETSSIPRQLEADFGGQLRLVGYALDGETTRPGETIHLTLYWQALAPMEVDYSVFVHLVGEDDLIIAQRDSYPGRGNRPTSGWSIGPIVEDVYPISIPATALAPRAYRLVVGAYDYGTMERLPLLDPEGDSLTLCEVTLLPAEGALPNPVHFVFGEGIALIGFNLEPTAVRPGAPIHLTLYWQALAPMEENYTVFTHLLGEKDQLWAQKDSQPQGGRSPTSGWEQGQVVEDRYELEIHPQAPPGTYDLEVGMYLAKTGKRLLVRGGGSRLMLGKVRILEP
jgi:4-amino-4-deoxy-L-arabinose transferase-like glycosyltransferase